MTLLLQMLEETCEGASDAVDLGEEVLCGQSAHCTLRPSEERRTRRRAAPLATPAPPQTTRHSNSPVTITIRSPLRPRPPAIHDSRASFSSRDMPGRHLYLSCSSGGAGWLSASEDSGRSSSGTASSGIGGGNSRSSSIGPASGEEIEGVCACACRLFQRGEDVVRTFPLENGNVRGVRGGVGSAMVCA